MCSLEKLRDSKAIAETWQTTIVPLLNKTNHSDTCLIALYPNPIKAGTHGAHARKAPS
jgi:hypothetical protein